MLGAGGSVAIDVNVAACEADGVPILRRASGGGTVLLGPGCLCFSLVLSYDSRAGLDDIRASNRYVLGRVSRTLCGRSSPRSIEGTSDLAVDGVKFSGNAQQRKRRHFLHHGTLLCGFDLALDREVPQRARATARLPPRPPARGVRRRTCPSRSQRRSGCSSRSGKRTASTSRCRSEQVARTGRREVLARRMEPAAVIRGTRVAPASHRWTIGHPYPSVGMPVSRSSARGTTRTRLANRPMRCSAHARRSFSRRIPDESHPHERRLVLAGIRR